MAVPTLRVARPTNDLDQLLPFYADGLGFEVLARFDDHEGFDGLVIGHPHAPYHLEFVRERGHAAGRAPSQEHLLVLYLPDAAEYAAALLRMAAAGFSTLASRNPYWDVDGHTYEDPDGYRVVITNRRWDS